MANAEWWLGRTPDARRRLQVALGELPAEPSPDRIRLRLALALTSLMGCDLADARDQASDAAADARAIGDPVFEAAALAGGAIARASAGEGPEAVDDGRRGVRAPHARAARDPPARLLDARPLAALPRAVRGARSPTSTAAPRSRARPAARTSGCS